MRRPSPRFICTTLVGLGILLTAIWATAAALMTGRGMGGANEGFYLNSYRWWDVNHRDFVGAQYFYGPVFHAVGNSVPGIRMFRLASVLGVHLLFGWSFMRWLRSYRPAAPQTPLWEAAGTLLITASGGVAYGWLPGTPGYNDVALLGSLTLASLVMLWLRASEQQQPVTWMISGAIGVVAFVMVLSKFSSGVAVLGIVGLGAGSVRRANHQALGRFLAPAAAGAAIATILFHLFVLNLGVALPPLVASVAVVAGSSHPVGEMAQFYLQTGLRTLALATALAAPVIALAFVARANRYRQVLNGIAAALVVAEVTLFLSTGGVVGGTAHVFGYSAMLAALVLVSAGVAFPHRPTLLRRSPTAPVFTILLLLPVLQAAGTNNALYSVTINGLAAWIALLLAWIPGPTTENRGGNPVAVTAMLLAVALGASVGAGGVTHDESSRSALSASLAHVRGIPELRGIALPAEQAQSLAAFRARVRAFVRPEGYPTIAYGDLSSYVFALGGRPVGNSWFSAQTDGLQSADLRAECAHGNPWGDHQPLVLADRRLSSSEAAGWRACGIDFYRDYRPVLVVQQPQHMIVWLDPSTYQAGRLRP